MYLNVQSLYSNYESIRLLMEERKPSILMCSESCLTDQINDFEVEIENYKIERCDSYSRHTGGVTVYIKSDINYKVLLNKCYFKNLWCIVFEIKKCDLKGIYTLLYHSPSTSDKHFLELFEHLCTKFVDPLKMCVTVGDFNIDVSKATTYSERLNDLIIDSGQKQIVDYFTRVTKESKTIIDLIITNNIFATSSTSDARITDHETLEITTTAREDKNDTYKTIISWKNYSKELLNEVLLRIGWNDFYDINDLNEKLVYICDNITKSVERLLDKKIVKCEIKNKWFDNELKNLKNEKIIAYTKAKFTNNESDWYNYTIAQKQYKLKIKLKSNRYTRQSIENSVYDKKKMWKCINKLTKVSNKSTSYKEIDFNGELVSDKSTFATRFNNYFIDSLNEIVNSIPNEVTPSVQLQATLTTSNRFQLDPISVEDLKLILNGFKNKSNKGDLLTTSVLKDSFDIIGFFLSNIINETFSKGEVPAFWKVSTVVPIPKVKNTRQACNFRPINVLPVTEKLLECAVKTQFLSYIEKSSILCKFQSGFRRSHSCETSLNFVLTNWKNAIDKKHFIVAVFLDFRRAFETIDKQILLNKLMTYGVLANELKWFNSYLSARMQKTSFEGVVSEERLVEYGVPQGSVLGPLLFILYINDIHTCVKYGQINLFADDTLLYIKTTNIEDGIQKLNEDLSNMHRWLNQNKLKLNVTKTKWIIISEKKNILNINKITIDGEIIERVKTIKYLGIDIDEHLKFNDYLISVKKKVSSTIYLLGRIRNKINVKTAKTIYNSTIQPHFDYCSSVLFQCNENQIKKLQKLQNRALRIILKRDRRSNINRMLTDLNILNVSQRIELNVLCLVYKLKNNLLPSYLCENLLYVHNVYSNMTLRNCENFRLPLCNKSSTQKNVFYNGLRSFNKLPVSIKTALSISIFKKNLLQYLKQSN